MNTKIFFLASMIFASGLTLRAQETETAPKDFIWSFKCKDKTRTLGLYAGLYGSYSEVDAQPAGNLGYRVGLVLNKRFTLGFGGYGIALEHQYNLANGEKYRIEAGYAGIYAEYLF